MVSIFIQHPLQHLAQQNTKYNNQNKGTANSSETTKTLKHYAQRISNVLLLLKTVISRWYDSKEPLHVHWRVCERHYEAHEYRTKFKTVRLFSLCVSREFLFCFVSFASENNENKKIGTIDKERRSLT